MKSQVTISKDHKGNVVERDILKLLFTSLPPGARYRITAEQFIERSTPLNDYYWLMMCDYLQPALYDAGNDRIRTKEDAHEFFKQLFHIKSTQELNDKEMIAYLEEINRYTAEYLGFALPSPDSTKKKL